MGEVFKPPFIGEKGTDWKFPEEFGTIRTWQANDGSRQQVRLFDTTFWQDKSQDALAEHFYLIRAEFRVQSNSLGRGTCQIPGIG